MDVKEEHVQVPVEKPVLIRSPADLRELLGFKNASLENCTKTNILEAVTQEEEAKHYTDKQKKTFINSLLYFYVMATPSKKGNKRKFKELDAIKALLNCPNIVESEDPVRQTLNTLYFLNEIKKMFPETENLLNSKTNTFKEVVIHFTSVCFKTPKPKSLKNTDIQKMCDSSMNQLENYLSEKQCIDFEYDIAEALTGKEKAKHLASIELNKKKPLYNRMGKHIFLGKHPRISDANTILAKENIALVVAAVNAREFKTHESKEPERTKSTPLFWEQKKIDLILVQMKDYGTPERGDTEHSDEELDATYTRIYFKCQRVAEKVKKDLKCYFHCKAGKGRSVTVLTVFFLFHPEELLDPQKLLDEIDVDPEKKMSQQAREAFLKTWAEKQAGFLKAHATFIAAGENLSKNEDAKIALNHCIRYLSEMMVLIRPHIDDVNKIGKPVFDCVCFIREREKKLLQSYLGARPRLYPESSPLLRRSNSSLAGVM